MAELSESGPALFYPEPLHSRGYDTISLLGADGSDLPVYSGKDAGDTALSSGLQSRDEAILTTVFNAKQTRLRRNGSSLVAGRGSGAKVTKPGPSKAAQRRERSPTPPMAPPEYLPNNSPLGHGHGGYLLPSAPLALVTTFENEFHSSLAIDRQYADLLKANTGLQALKRDELTHAEVVDFFRECIFPNPSIYEPGNAIRCGLQRHMDEDALPASPDTPTGRRKAPVPDITFGYGRVDAFSKEEQVKLRDLARDPVSFGQSYAPVLPFFTVHFQDQDMDDNYVEIHKPLLSTACSSNTAVMMNNVLASKAADPSLRWTPSPDASVELESISFAAAISRRQLSIYITWKNEHSSSGNSSVHPPPFCTICIAIYDTHDEWDLARFRRWAHSIVGWGSSSRLNQIKSILDALPLACCPLPPSLFSPSIYGLEIDSTRIPKPADIDALVQSIKSLPGSASDATATTERINHFLLSEETILSHKERRQLRAFHTGATKSELKSWFRDRILPVKNLPEALQTSERVSMNSKSFPLPRVAGLGADASELPLQPPHQASMPVPDIIYGYDPSEAFPLAYHRYLLDNWREGQNALARQNAGFVFPFFSVRFIGGDGDDDEETEAQAREDCLVTSAICVGLVDSLNQRCAEASAAGNTNSKANTVSYVSSAAFSLVVSYKTAELFVTWKVEDGQGQEGQGHETVAYRMASVMKIPVATLDVWMVFRMTVGNIVSWGATRRLNCIRRALDSVMPMARGAEEAGRDDKPMRTAKRSATPRKEKPRVDPRPRKPQRPQKQTAAAISAEKEQSLMDQIRMSIEV